MTAGTHGSTFGGNPLAAAVGNAVLDVILADGFLDHVRRVAGTLSQRLASLPSEFPSVVAELRGAGLLLGLRCQVPNTAFADALRRGGLLVAGAGDNVVRLVPPLTVHDTHIDEAAAALERACRELAQ